MPGMSVCYYYLNSAAKMRRRKSGLNIVYNLCPQEFLLHFLLEVGFLFFFGFFLVNVSDSVLQL